MPDSSRARAVLPEQQAGGGRPAHSARRTSAGLGRGAADGSDWLRFGLVVSVRDVFTVLLAAWLFSPI
jgi:hypothetical protein